MKKIFVLVVAALGALALFLVPEGIPIGEVYPDGTYFGPMKTAQMQKVFEQNNYNMVNQIENKQPVPRLFIEKVPSDFNAEKFDQVRPALFTEMMLPSILKANNTVLAERATIAELMQKVQAEDSLTAEQIALLEKTAQKYNVDFTPDDLNQLFFVLMPRIDQVPPTLLLAMAAQDSGFATSQYARDYNALYNERDWDGNGVDPSEETKDGETYKIKTFPTIYDAVLSQIHYLNTNGYFDNFRMTRERYRRTDNEMRGYSIAGYFLLFPNRDFIYPDILKHLIEQYGWTPLDSIHLAN